MKLKRRRTATQLTLSSHQMLSSYRGRIYPLVRSGSFQVLEPIVQHSNIWLLLYNEQTSAIHQMSFHFDLMDPCSNKMPQRRHSGRGFVRNHVDRQKSNDLWALVAREVYTLSSKDFASDVQASNIYGVTTVQVYLG